MSRNKGDGNMTCLPITHYDDLDENVREMFKNILNLLSDGIYISDSRGATLFVNESYRRITGIEYDNLVGKYVTDLKRDGLFSTVLNPEIVRTGRTVTSVQTISNKGKKRRVILTGHPVFDKGKHVALVVTFVRDITVMTDLREQISAQRELIERHHQSLQRLTDLDVHANDFLSHSPAMRDTVNLANRISTTDATVLITGETGVGKGILAKKIHRASRRKDKPFFTVDCTTIPENLFESELFGYAPGAFSGAQQKGKPGFFEMADKGTLFLDEIGELPAAMQSKLLRVLQDQEIVRIGGTRSQKVDVRIIAATNRNPREEVDAGRFRSDLFFRLSVASLEIPPLRKRQEAILPFVRYFQEKFNARYRKNMTFSQECESFFTNYAWPGNVREMENLIHRMIITSADEEIQPVDLPESLRSCSCRPGEKYLMELCRNEQRKSLKSIMAKIENNILRNAMRVHGSINDVAELFQVDRTTISRKLKRFH